MTTNNPIADLSEYRKTRTLSSDVLQQLQDTSKVITFDDITIMINKLATESNEYKLVRSVLDDKGISNPRKSMFFQAMHNSLNKSDFYNIGPYITLGLYYGLMADGVNPTISIATSSIIRHCFLEQTSQGILTDVIIPQLGQEPFKMSGNERLILKEKINVAILSYIQGKKRVI